MPGDAIVKPVLPVDIPELDTILDPEILDLGITAPEPYAVPAPDRDD